MKSRHILCLISVIGVSPEHPEEKPPPIKLEQKVRHISRTILPASFRRRRRDAAKRIQKKETPLERGAP
jgi:hypothetical protein